MIERGGAKAWAGGKPAVPALTVAVGSLSVRAAGPAGLLGLDLAGTVEEDDVLPSWGHEGAEVALCVNPAGTAFLEGVLGQGRIYADRIEVDIVLPAGEAEALASRLAQPAPSHARPSHDRPSRHHLRLTAQPITETLLRITGFEIC
ncbi:hypothetical protein EDF57_10266 [Novosphingobium sp. PhB55]|uniref:hypothetical protein n=1 Tax=Novosphingobium sp. PhB55 TaxID=2485106 RepID=UPI0010652CAB|nr:hypothetical protein [Novosphingobium sp. PhB55]TDW67183.1 hypothetical protein EDF57_10266 [Novosphingobium sp. PhB55]